MDANAIQEWTACEEEWFKGLFVETTNENPSDKMEMPMQQLTDQDHFDAFGDTLSREMHVEPSINGATSDSSDWYKILFEETHDSVLDLSAEIPLNQPSEQLVVEAGGEVAMQKPRRKYTPKKRRAWTTEEHRLFLCGMQHFGRGDWKAISTYYIPSRTPAQLASHAQKYFKRIEKDDLYHKSQRYGINGVKLGGHNRNNTWLSGTEPEKAKPTEPIIPQALPTEDMDFLDDMTFLDDLVQGMPTFGQTSNSATNVARQMPFNNGILGSLQWENRCPTNEQGSVLLDQAGGISAETRTGPFYSQSLGMTNQIYKNNIVLPSVFTAQTSSQVLLHGQGGYNPTYFPSAMVRNNQYNVHPTMAPPF